MSTRKTTLYCYDCGYEPAADEEWIVHVHGGDVDTECPECGTTIDSRPQRTGNENDG